MASLELEQDEVKVCHDHKTWSYGDRSGTYFYQSWYPFNYVFFEHSKKIKQCESAIEFEAFLGVA